MLHITLSVLEVAYIAFRDVAVWGKFKNEVYQRNIRSIKNLHYAQYYAEAYNEWWDPSPWLSA